MFPSKIIPISKNSTRCVVRLMDGVMIYYHINNERPISKIYDNGVWRIKSIKKFPPIQMTDVSKIEIK